MGGHFYALFGRFVWLFTTVSVLAAVLASGLAMFVSPLAFALVATVVLLVVGQECAEDLGRRLGRCPTCAEKWRLARWQAVWAFALILPAPAIAAQFLPFVAGVPWDLWLMVFLAAGVAPLFLFRLGMGLARTQASKGAPG